MYSVPVADVLDEDAWLKDLKIYPSKQVYVDWSDRAVTVRYAMIVTPAVGILIKMRHPVQFQAKYAP
jgi:hypothetical protein